MDTPFGQLSDDPRQQATQVAMLKLLSSSPEPILNLLDRLSIPWERKTDSEGAYLVIRWGDLMEGETRNQQAGPFIKKLMEEMKGELAKIPEPVEKAEPERVPDRKPEVEF